jgi:prolyl-tRNA synthetase
LFAECKRAGLRVKLDDRDGQSPGFKFNEWDMRGVPLRIELGARDLEAGVATLVRRDRAFKEDGQKRTVPLTEIVAAIPAALDEVQAALFAQARAYLSAHTLTTADRATFFALLEERAGLIEIPWCERPACEAAVKEATSATTRNLRRPAAGPACVACGEPATAQAFFAQSY